MIKAMRAKLAGWTSWNLVVQHKGGFSFIRKVSWQRRGECQLPAGGRHPATRGTVGGTAIAWGSQWNGGGWRSRWGETILCKKGFSWAICGPKTKNVARKKKSQINMTGSIFLACEWNKFNIYIFARNFLNRTLVNRHVEWERGSKESELEPWGEWFVGKSTARL